MRFAPFYERLRTRTAGLGPAATTWLLVRLAAGRVRFGILNALGPPRVECPCCGWRGHTFVDFVEAAYTLPRVSCPRCRSQTRHRQLRLWMARTFRPDVRHGTALVCAPEPGFTSMWTALPTLRVVRLDREPSRGVDVIGDLQALPLRSASVDLAWCHHVLEHLADDRRALRELARVLRPGTGELIVSVPMKPGTRTEEYGRACPDLSGHWRMYGDDFVERLATAGFQATPAAADLDDSERTRYGIAVPEPVFLCRSAPADQT